MKRRKDILKSSRKIKRKGALSKIFIWAGAVFLFLLIISGLLYLPYFKIQKISISGNNFLETKMIITEVQDFLARKNLFIVPQDNILLLSKKILKSDLLNKFPRAEAISINKNLPHEISINITERKQEALFCGSQSNSQCAFIDENGYIFENAPYFSDNLYLKFFDERSETASIGKNILTQDKFRNLISFKNLLSQENIKIFKINLEKEGIYKLSTDAGWLIMLNEQNEPNLTFENLKITLNKIGNKQNILDYIDLRFGNKVYYKFK